MWPFTRKKPAYKIAELDNLALVGSRDSAGFQFGALVRTKPAAQATVFFHVDSALSLSDEEIMAWEETIALDNSVVCSALTATEKGCLMSVTVARESKQERQESDEILTRLAATLPSLYDLDGVVATPMLTDEIESYIATALGTTRPLWPELRVEDMEQTLTDWRVNGITSASFDALDDQELDRTLRELVLSDGFAGVARWTRVFRPALEADDAELGRHSGILTIAAEASSPQLEMIVDAVMDELSAMQRLRLRRMFSRQQTGCLAGLGVGVNAWEFDKVLAI